MKYAIGRYVAEIRAGTYGQEKPKARKASAPDRKSKKKVESVRRIPKRAAFKKRKSR